MVVCDEVHTDKGPYFLVKDDTQDIHSHFVSGTYSGDQYSKMDSVHQQDRPFHSSPHIHIQFIIDVITTTLMPALGFDSLNAC